MEKTDEVSEGMETGNEFLSVTVIAVAHDGSENIVTVKRLQGAIRGGRAILKDDKGYFHATLTNGIYRSLYPERYELVGQFRNGIANVCSRGRWIAINEDGRQIGLFADTRR